MDDKGAKMSKSLGNVVDPDNVTWVCVYREAFEYKFQVTDGSLHQKPLGADGLRLWVALHGAENPAESRIGKQVLEEVYKKVRYCFRFRHSSRSFYSGCQSSIYVYCLC